MQYEVKSLSLSWHPSHHHLSWTRRPQWPSQQLCKPDNVRYRNNFQCYQYLYCFTFLWFFKVVTWEKPRLHHSQWYGFSPVWDRLCLCKNSFFILLNLSLFRKFHSPANTKLWRILSHNLGTSVFSRYCAASCAGWQSLGCWTLAHSPRTKIKFVD